MTEVSFYHLERSTLEQALPKLLEKTLQAGKRALVLARSEERVEKLSQDLWTYDPASWLPHGTLRDGNPEDQPIWLSTEPGATEAGDLNKATFLFLTDGATCDWMDAYERCFELFDGHDAEAVQAARLRWKGYKEAGFTLAYWQQNDRGAWEKKA